jgi:hypothetical protein
VETDEIEVKRNGNTRESGGREMRIERNETNRKRVREYENVVRRTMRSI